MRQLAIILLASHVLLGCGAGSQGTSVDLAPPAEHTTLGPGDIFQLKIVGEKDLPEEYQVARDGTVTLPYIHTIDVVGLEPQELAAKVREQLIEKKILTDPSVVVTVQEYRSKHINLLGQVAKPGTFPLSPNMTLVQAISMAGGLTSIAQSSRVNLTRKDKDGAKTVVIDVEAIIEGRAPDIPLQTGDSIYIPERVF